LREINVNDIVFRVRGLKRSELSDMASNGYPITRWGIDLTGLGSDDKAAEMFDAIMDMGSTGPKNINLEDLTPAEERRIFFAIIAETFGSGDEEKNLSRSGSGTQTGSE